jgi:lectin-like protein
MLRYVCIIAALDGCGRVNFETNEDAGCPTGYTPAGSSCYRLDSTLDTDWLSAEHACENDALGAHLVAIEDAAELQTVDLLTTVQDAWIGTSDRIVPETYLTVTGSPAYVAWASGQPDDAGGPEYCVMLAGETMHDDDCPTINDFVCEFDRRLPDPSTF